MFEEFGTFLGISILVIVTPGPDTALTIRNTLSGGRSGGTMTALGVAAGQMIWALASAAGVVAILIASETVFDVIRLVGAAYLIYLGLQGLMKAFAIKRQERLFQDARSAQLLRRWIALKQGLISNLANPKMAVFFTSLLPQFASPGESFFLDLTFLGAIFASMTAVWLIAYAFVVAKAGEALMRPRARRFIEGFTGGILVWLGLRIALADR